jgi:hypothetical protein
MKKYKPPSFVDVETLLWYELPTIAEYIWFDWGQDLMAKYVSWIINRKLKRFNRRQVTKTFFEQEVE